MFIETQATQDPRTLRFLPGREVLARGGRVFEAAGTAAASPLAAGLFAEDGVARVVLGADYIDVTLAPDAATDWSRAKPPILARIMDHFVTGRPVLIESGPAEDEGDGDPDVARQIEDLLETRIRPAMASNEATVELKRFKDGVAELAISASAISYLGPIGNMMRHYIPEVTSVREWRDLGAAAGLGTPAGLRVQRLLDDEINPAVASHGGYIALVDVLDNVVYLRLEGGCQGCGMANVTLKQGVEAAIRRELPEIVAVRDTTDHAGGSNPYYQPGSK
jgi:Fe-S cluster biogenesis protein NfuA